MNPTVNGSAACAGGEANAAGRASVTAASKNERREAGVGERREGNVIIGPSKMRGVSGSFPPAQFLVTFQVWGLPALVKGRAVRHPGAHDHSDAAAANRCGPPDPLLDGGLDLGTLARLYASGRTTPADVVKAVLSRIRHRGDDGVWISVASPQALDAALEALERRRAAGHPLPLYGVPFGVKDNIDVAGFATTAGCAAFSHQPRASAPAVQKLLAAGAIVIGKTNLDQFATGLVGVRSPYGFPRNAMRRDLIPGGSSSGSAVAVAAGLVPLA